MTKKTLPILFVLALLGQLAFAHFALAAPDINCSGDAWGEKVGWISLSGTAGDSTEYGVTVTDSGLSGYAWAEKTGWIRMRGETGACVQPGGGCPTGYTYGVLNDGSGNLSGYAWGEKVGWIRFAATDSDYLNDSASNYGVTVGSDFDGYAWGEKTGWISFSGDIQEGGTYGATSGWAAGEEEAVPEFTTITAIIAFVLGFGIYLLIKRKNSRKG